MPTHRRFPMHGESQVRKPATTGGLTLRTNLKGIAALKKGLVDCQPILKNIEITRLTADDQSCAAALKFDTVFGVLPFLEHFLIVAGQILAIHAYYDPRPILEAMKRKP